MSKLGQKCPKIVRIYGATVEKQDYPVPGRNAKSCNGNMQGLGSDPRLKARVLNILIEYWLCYRLLLFLACSVL